MTLGRSARSSARRETTSGYNESEEVGSDEDLGSDDYEDEREWDMETFDTRMLVQGAEDERYLDSLPELERENILAERFEKLKCEADMKKAIRENR
jgi:RNA polymerase-associated protein RTF1